jgi:hypothetical protein
MEIFKDATGKAYAVFSKAIKPSKAVTLANSHFKVKKADLEIFEGKRNGDNLNLRVKRGNCWVVTRK